MKTSDVLTLSQLRQCMPALSLTKAAAFLPFLQDAMVEFDITTANRKRAFLAQLGHESSDLTKWRENMSYSAGRLREVFSKYFPTAASAQRVAHHPVEIADIVYGGRMGNTRPGDGWKFIARGPIGITGRDMYASAGRYLGLRLTEDPTLAEDPKVGFRIAAWCFVVEKHLLPLCDRLQGLNVDGLHWVDATREIKTFTTITRGINGGTNGLSDRIVRYRRAAMAIPETDFKAFKASQTVKAPSTPGASDSPDVQTDANLAPDVPSVTQTPPVVETVDGQQIHGLLKSEKLKLAAPGIVRRVGLYAVRPIVALWGAIEGGNWLAISGTVFVLFIVIVLLGAHYKEIKQGIVWLKQNAVRVVKDWLS